MSKKFACRVVSVLFWIVAFAAIYTPGRWSAVILGVSELIAMVAWVAGDWPVKIKVQFSKTNLVLFGLAVALLVAAFLVK